MRGVSLHFGLNKVSPIVYQGWEGVLKTCEADALLMETIAKRSGFNSMGCYLTQAATKLTFKEKFQEALSKLNDEDILFLSFSGHGGKIPDKNGDELDGEDEFWFFYDGIITDDFIFKLLNSITKKIRILIISDSCFSGTIILKGEKDNLLSKSPHFSAKLRQEIRTKAAIQLIASSKENQYSWTGATYSLFTEVLEDILIQQCFNGNYNQFAIKIKEKITKRQLKKKALKQLPVHLKIGNNVENFALQSPFQIKI